MKFVCDRCGKKYATAGDPAPGKVYKLKCKACGHLIVVRGQAGTTTVLPVAGAPAATAASPVTEPALSPPPAPRPEIELHVEPEPKAPEPIPSPAPSPPEVSAQEPEPIAADAIQPLAPAGDPGPAPLPPEVALAADTAAGANLPEPPAPPSLPLDLPEPTPAPMDPALTPPPPEKDELADFAAAAAEVMAAPVAGEPKGPGYVDLFGDGGEKKPEVDPFTAAARASLPDAWAGLPPAASPAEKKAAPPPAPPPPRKSAIGGAPMAIIGLGLVGLAAITAYALLGRGGSPPPPVIAAPPAVPAPRPPVPEVKPPEPVAEPAPAPPVVEKQAEPKARPPERKPERKPAPVVVEKKPEPARPPPAPPPLQVAAAPPPSEPRTESRDVDLPDAAAALTQEVVNKVVGANRKAFSTCIAAAAGSGVKLDGRRVALRITVNTNGTVTYPTLDDQELNTTEMGQCLKSAARLMIFPKFKGDPFHYEVPLILTGN